MKLLILICLVSCILLAIVLWRHRRRILKCVVGGSGGSNNNNKQIVSEKVVLVDLPDSAEYQDAYGQLQTYRTRRQIYQDLDSDIQIQTILKRGNPDDISGLIKLLKSRSKKLNIFNLHRKDSEIYREMCREYPIIQTDTSRDEYHASGLFNVLQPYLPRGGVRKYLDFGCGKGLITRSISARLDHPETHCVEVTKYPEHSNLGNSVAFTYTDSKLPFPDNTFDLITAFMSLHHVKDLKTVLEEIRRTLRPGGVLFIKEHDCWSAGDAMLIDIEHQIFAHCVDRKPLKDVYDTEYTCHFINRWGWEKLLAPLEFRDGDFYYSNVSARQSATRAFWGVFIKPE